MTQSGASAAAAGPASPRWPSGTLIVVAFAVVLGLGLALIAVYKAGESALPPVSATFERVAAAPANATVHDLDFRAVHTTDSFLEDHLNTVLQRGASRETDRLRVGQMRDSVRMLAGVDDAALYVRWEGTVVHLAFT